MAAAKRRRTTRRDDIAKRRRPVRQTKEKEEKKLREEKEVQKIKEDVKEEPNERNDDMTTVEDEVSAKIKDNNDDESNNAEKDDTQEHDEKKPETVTEDSRDGIDIAENKPHDNSDASVDKELQKDGELMNNNDGNPKLEEEIKEYKHDSPSDNKSDASTENGSTDQAPKDGCKENVGVKRSSNVKIFDKVKHDDLGLPMVGELISEEVDEEPIDEEEKKRVVGYTFDGEKYSYKEKPSVIEEREGKIEFRVVNNDGKRDSLIILTGLKNIFQKQLPEMPKAYITRLVFDRSHVSIAVIRKPLTVVGGITIKPFESHHFAEIVFCAISSSEQVRGYGAHMMNHLKTFVRGMMDIQYFLTYADNYAIGYFKKQGFTKEITLPKRVWMGYIKDYEGGTLMQCSMLPKIRYLDAPKILSLQRAAILRKIRSVGHSHVIRPGLVQFKNENFKPMNPLDIPGIKHAGWTKETDELAKQPKRSPVYPIMLTLLTEMQNSPSNWPFLQPVNKKEVPDYYEVIAEPMDLSTMEVKLENNAYETLDDFIYDCRLIFNNCRQYNGESTTFYKNANKLEKVLINKLKDYPEYSQYCDMLQQDK